MFGIISIFFTYLSVFVFGESILSGSSGSMTSIELPFFYNSDDLFCLSKIRLENITHKEINLSVREATVFTVKYLKCVILQEVSDIPSQVREFESLVEEGKGENGAGIHLPSKNQN